MRNPLITAELMVAWGIAITFASAGLLGYAVLLTVASHWVVVRVEEPELRKRFGESYESYCREVPRWIPRLGVGKPATKGTVL